MIEYNYRSFFKSSLVVRVNIFLCFSTTRSSWYEDSVLVIFPLTRVARAKERSLVQSSSSRNLCDTPIKLKRSTERGLMKSVSLETSEAVSGFL